MAESPRAAGAVILIVLTVPLATVVAWLADGLAMITSENAKGHPGLEGPAEPFSTLASMMIASALGGLVFGGSPDEPPVRPMKEVRKSNDS